jgi:hypothetical protein
MGGIAAILSGVKKYADARVHAEALKELTKQLPGRSRAQVVEVEGHTFALTGTREASYREWRQAVKQLYEEENGAAAAPPAGPHRPPATTTDDVGLRKPPSGCSREFVSRHKRYVTNQKTRPAQAVRPLRASSETRRRWDTAEVCAARDELRDTDVALKVLYSQFANSEPPGRCSSASSR